MRLNSTHNNIPEYILFSKFMLSYIYFSSTKEPTKTRERNFTLFYIFEKYEVRKRSKVKKNIFFFVWKDFSRYQDEFLYLVSLSFVNFEILFDYNLKRLNLNLCFKLMQKFRWFWEDARVVFSMKFNINIIKQRKQLL